MYLSHGPTIREVTQRQGQLAEIGALFMGRKEVGCVCGGGGVNREIGGGVNRERGQTERGDVNKERGQQWCTLFMGMGSLGKSLTSSLTVAAGLVTSISKLSS